MLAAAAAGSPPAPPPPPATAYTSRSFTIDTEDGDADELIPLPPLPPPWASRQHGSSSCATARACQSLARFDSTTTS